MYHTLFSSKVWGKRNYYSREWQQRGKKEFFFSALQLITFLNGFSFFSAQRRNSIACDFGERKEFSLVWIYGARCFLSIDIKSSSFERRSEKKVRKEIIIFQLERRHSCKFVIKGWDENCCLQLNKFFIFIKHIFFNLKVRLRIKFQVFLKLFK